MAACREKQQGPDEDKWWLPRTDAKTCLLTAGGKYIMTIFDDTILALLKFAACMITKYIVRIAGLEEMAAGSKIGAQTVTMWDMQTTVRY